MTTLYKLDLKSRLITFLELEGIFSIFCDELYDQRQITFDVYFESAFIQNNIPASSAISIAFAFNYTNHRDTAYWKKINAKWRELFNTPQVPRGCKSIW